MNRDVGKTMIAGADPIFGGIKNAKIVRFENSGHALFYEEREKFNTELINFIEKKTPSKKIFIH
jgi:pimeloyl-ACP methyl ester carboxylesterase